MCKTKPIVASTRAFLCCYCLPKSFSLWAPHSTFTVICFSELNEQKPSPINWVGVFFLFQRKSIAQCEWHMKCQWKSCRLMNHIFSVRLTWTVPILRKHYLTVRVKKPLFIPEAGTTGCRVKFFFSEMIVWHTRDNNAEWMVISVNVCSGSSVS